jgi:hypothetical protein
MLFFSYYLYFAVKRPKQYTVLAFEHWNILQQTNNKEKWSCSLTYSFRCGIYTFVFPIGKAFFSMTV